MSDTPTEPITLVMSPAYAYAVRQELEAIGRVLEPFDEAAGRAGDIDVLALVARVKEAIHLTIKIQAERQTTPPPRVARHRKGVTLAKD
jgi:hypothetical protein